MSDENSLIQSENPGRGGMAMASGDHILLGLLVILVGHALYCWSVGWNQPIVDAHGFRQTQTAISCYYMNENGFSIAYKTPVLGPPWKIPFEFPIYHWVVVGLTRLGLDLEPAGRLVSILSYAMALLGVYIGSAAIIPEWRHRTLVVMIALANPYYLFWSRTFMIEMTAVALGVWTVVLTGYYCRSGRWFIGGLAIVVGCLAALQKITSFPAYYACAIGLVAWHWRKHDLSTARAAFISLALAIIPVLVTKGWVGYADELKSQNEFGEMLTSANLSTWNYGSLADRLNLDWAILLLYRLNHVIYHPTVLIASVLVVAVTYRHWRQYVWLLLSFVAPLFLFAPLYGHSYYLCANLLVLLLLLSVAISHAVAAGGYRAWLGIAAATLTIGVGIYQSHALYLPLQRHPSSEHAWVGRSISPLTEKDKVLVGIGMDWSSVVPYYAQRKALLFPGTPGAQELAAGKELLSDHQVGGLVVWTLNETGSDEDLSRFGEFSAFAESLGLSKKAIQLRFAWYLFPDARTQELFNLVSQARELFAQQRIEESLAVLNELPETFNDGLFLKATIHFSVNQPESALRALKRMTENLPGDSLTWATAGEHVLRYAEVDPRYLASALRFVDRAIELEPLRNAYFYNLRSRARRIAGDLQGSQSDQRRAREVHSLRMLDENGDLPDVVTASS